MADGTPPELAAAPSDGELAGEVAAKKPANEEARQKEADRARRRRVMEKLKAAKSEDELRRLMQKYSGAAGVDGEADALSLKPPEVMEPGQRPGWPAPSKVTGVQEMLEGAIAGTAEVAEGLIVGFAGDPATSEGALVGVTVCACFKKDAPPGRKLAEAWAPLVALYAPAWMDTPGFAAAIGTLQVGGMVLGSVKATLEARDEQLKAELARKREAAK